MSDNVLEIPGYRLHGELGKGGMAEVYLATQESLHRKVAIKVLRSADDEAFSRRFVREAHIVASLSHPSIITIHDIDRLADGRYYLAMEFVAGGDLAQQRGETFAPSRALDIVRQVASGLAVVHERGLVHRDIKPANILFREDGTAVITDFGIAKELELDSELTQFGIAVGSPAYSSPEQAQCLDLDARTDIYSLGVILLEMLLGHNPFRGANYTQTVMNHVQQTPPALPASLVAYQPLLERMLAKDPQQRFADCRELLAALDGAQSSTVTDTVDLDSTRIAPAAVLPERQAGAVERRGAVLWVWLLLGLLLAGTAGMLGYNAYLQQRIDNLVAEADKRLGEGKLIEPALDNADHFLRQAQQLDADAPQVLAGLQRLLDARIARALQQAEQALGEDRLLLPEDDSAVFHYQQVLGWAPAQEQALAGLARVVQRFAELSEEAYKRREYSLALAYIQQGLQVEPSDAGLLERLDHHEQRVASLEAKRRSRAKANANTGAGSSAGSTATTGAESRPQNPIKRMWNRLIGE